MAINKLTDRAVRGAKPRLQEYEMTDGGGLAIRIKPDGAKLWAVRYTAPSGKRLREYVGSFPTLSLSDARQIAERRRTLVAKGINPQRAKAMTEIGDDDTPTTVRELFKVWHTKHVERHRTNENDRKSIQARFDKYVDPQIGDVRLDAVRRGQIMRAIDQARDAGAMRTANVILTELRQMFRYAVAREWIQGDPTAAINRKDAGGTDRERDRVLSDEEIILLRDRMASPPSSKTRYYVARRRVLPAHIELAVWWTLTTGARAIEVASMRKDSVSTGRRIWTIPADIAKNDAAHVVQLSDFAMAVWGRLEPMACKVYVFDGRGEGTHLSEKEVTRRLTDRQPRDRPIKGRKNSTDLELPGGHWTQHDLRRTAATIMGEAGVAEEVIDRCINHKEENKNRRTYQRQKMMPQRKAAFDTLGDHLTKLLGDPEEWLPGDSGRESPTHP